MSKSLPVPVVMLASSSDVLLDDLTKLAAAAGVEPTIVRDEAGLRRTWSQAGLLVLGHDLGQVVARAPVRRERVVLVARHGERAAMNEIGLALGAERVVVLPDDQSWLVDQMAVAAEGRAAGIVAVVIGSRGGAGASTVLASTARQAVGAGLTCAAVDADPLGGDLDLALAMVDEPGLRWHDLASSRGRLPAGPLAAALPHRDGVSLLCAGTEVTGVPEGSITPAVDALARAFDLVLVDVPRWLPGECRHVVDAADVVILVTTADLRGVASAGRLRADLGAPARPVQLVVRSTRGGVDPDEVAALLELPHVSTLRNDRRVAGDAAGGDVVMRPALRRAAQRLLVTLAGAQTSGGRPR